MTQPPPALNHAPQFDPAYWTKVPRQMFTAHIERVTKVDHPTEEWVEIVLKEGPRLRRRRAEIQQLLAPNSEVQVETVNKDLVTGLLVPNVGWAFRMTSQDLADYTRELSVQVHRQQMAAEEAMVTHVAVDLDKALDSLGIHSDDSDHRAEVALQLSKLALSSLKAGPR